MADTFAIAPETRAQLVSLLEALSQTKGGSSLVPETLPAEAVQLLAVLKRDPDAVWKVDVSFENLDDDGEEHEEEATTVVVLASSEVDAQINAQRKVREDLEARHGPTVQWRVEARWARERVR